MLWQTTHQYMEEWLDERCSGHLDRLLFAEARGDVCSSCGVEEVHWRCLTCHGRPRFCSSCCRAVHRKSPFHHVERWNGNSYQRGWLWQAGVIVCLGHNGDLCPSYSKSMEALESRAMHLEGYHDYNPPDHRNDPTYGAKPGIEDLGDGRFVTFVHLNGYHHLPVYPCKCERASFIPEDEQFLDAGYFPATWAKVSTVFSLELLDDFHLTRVEAKMSTENYCDILRRKTNWAFPDKTPVRCPSCNTRHELIAGSRTGIEN